MVADYANYGIGLFAVLLIGAYLRARRDRDLTSITRSLWAALAAPASVGVAVLIGGQIDRARPYTALANVHVLLDRSADFSFPSDHATATSAIAAGIYLVNRRLGILAGIGALLMAFARVYAGVHYPSDVLAGLALGTTIGFVGGKLLYSTLLRLVQRAAESPVRPLLSARE